MISMKKGLASLMIVLMAFIIMLGSSFSVAFADDPSGENPAESTTSLEDYVQQNITAINDYGVTFGQSWLRNYFTIDQNKASTSNPEQIVVNGSDGSSYTLYLINGKTREQAEAQMATALKNDATVDDVSNITDGLKIGADTAGATALLSGFAPIISLVVGVIVVLVTMGMTLFTAFDIAYIAFPVFRNKCEEQKMMGGNNIMTKKGANGESSLRFVTDDAQYAVSQGTIESGKSPWGIYFRKRIMSYILLAIILFILLTGNISLITNIALNVVSGIMNVLGGLA